MRTAKQARLLVFTMILILGLLSVSASNLNIKYLSGSTIVKSINSDGTVDITLPNTPLTFVVSDNSEGFTMNTASPILPGDFPTFNITAKDIGTVNLSNSDINIGSRYIIKKAYAFKISPVPSTGFTVQIDHSTIPTDKVRVIKAPFDFATNTINYDSRKIYSSDRQNLILNTGTKTALNTNSFSAFLILEDNGSGASTLGTCGDGYVDAGEACDGGSSCTSSCTKTSVSSGGGGGGGRGGGGGGGASMALSSSSALTSPNIAPYVLVSKALFSASKTPVTVFMYTTSKQDFIANGEIHSLILESVSGNIADFVIKTKDVVNTKFSLNVGESKEFDLDNNGYNEVKLTLAETQLSRAKVTFQRQNNEVPIMTGSAVHPSIPRPEPVVKKPITEFPSPSPKKGFPWTFVMLSSILIIIIGGSAMGYLKYYQDKALHREQEHDIEYLRQYIQETLSAGYDVENVKQMLADAGWSDDIIEEEISKMR